MLWEELRDDIIKIGVGGRRKKRNRRRRNKMEEQAIRFSNQVMDEGIFQEVKQYMYPADKQKKLFIVSVAAVILGAVLLRTNIFGGVVVIVIGALVLMEVLMMKNRAPKAAITQIQKVTGKDYCTYTYTLGEHALNIFCVETKVKENLSYEMFTRKTETELAFVLFTRENRLVIFRKDTMGEQRLSQLKKIIEEKCKNLAAMK